MDEEKPPLCHLRYLDNEEIKLLEDMLEQGERMPSFLHVSECAERDFPPLLFSYSLECREQAVGNALMLGNGVFITAKRNVRIPGHLLLYDPLPEKNLCYLYSSEVLCYLGPILIGKTLNPLHVLREKNPLMDCSEGKPGEPLYVVSSTVDKRGSMEEKLSSMQERSISVIEVPQSEIIYKPYSCKGTSEGVRLPVTVPGSHVYNEDGSLIGIVEEEGLCFLAEQAKLIILAHVEKSRQRRRKYH